MSKVHKLYIGLNDKETKKQELTLEQAFSIIRLALIRSQLDSTITTGYGYYTHFSGVNVSETTIIVEVIEFLKPVFDEILKMVDYLKSRLNQESIAYQVIEGVKCELL